MARRLRNEQPGSTYHVIARGVERRRTFVDNHDYDRYTRLLASVVKRQGWHLLCYCLMPNHVHLIVETPEANLGAGMHWLHGLYAQTFNERHDRVGHLFEDRFKSPPVRTDAALVRLVGYVATNPVAAQLAKRAIHWPWGSHAVMSSPGLAPGWLAHGRLVRRLEAATGWRCYEDIVASWERGGRY